MRLIKEFPSENQAKNFSIELTKAKIASQIESPKNATSLCFLVWIIHEDDVHKAHDILTSFLNKTDEEKNALPPLPPAPPTSHIQDKFTQTPPFVLKMRPATLPSLFDCKATLFILFLCIGCFFLQSLNDFYQTSHQPTSFYQNEVNQTLLIDYPKQVDLLLKLQKLRPQLSFDKETSLSHQEQLLIDELEKTPSWKGFYTHSLLYFKKNKTPDEQIISWQKERFLEKVQEGEIWRLWTPCILHGGWLHLLFNGMWIIVLGKQTESRIGAPRFLLLILVIGIVSNLAQYAMTGPAFLGISGVVTGLIAFIWSRQKHNPWEGYWLHSSTFTVMGFFLLLPLLAQTASFYTEIYGGSPLSLISTANTAHFCGLFIGWILAKLPLFKAKLSS